MKLTNTMILHNGYVEVICETNNYKHSVYLDQPQDIKSKMRITNRGYAYFTSSAVGVASVASNIMNHEPNMVTVVDHINGNRLDNRRKNLRVVTQCENSRNKSHFVRNNTGIVGIAYRKNGKYEYYRVSLVNTKGTPKIREYAGKTKRYYPRVTKQFNINKLGKQEAFKQAQDYLHLKKQELGYL